MNRHFLHVTFCLSRSIILLLLAGCITPERVSFEPRISDRSELAHVISHKLQSGFRYPDRAKTEGWEGWVLVEALIKSDGSLAGLEVYRHSGCTDLIVDAIETVERSFPISAHIPLERNELLSVAVPIHYELDQASRSHPFGVLQRLIADSLTRTVRAIQQYPEEAKHAAREGIVMTKVLVEADGTIIDAQIQESSGHPDLDAHALATIQSVGSVYDRRCSPDPRRVEVQFPIQYALPAPDRAALQGGRHDYTWLARDVFAKFTDIGFYPAQAVESGWEGTVVVSTIIRSDGTIPYSWIDRSSGIPLLDQAAMQSVRGLSPLKLRHPLGQAKVIVTLPITYSTTSRP
ncbi:MAG: putative TonB protein [Nitrospira sp. OLB3]|nr:MAG: putative TonB protein [Nitrospira sp. OLB3]